MQVEVDVAAVEDEEACNSIGDYRAVIPGSEREKGGSRLRSGQIKTTSPTEMVSDEFGYNTNMAGVEMEEERRGGQQDAASSHATRP